MSVEKLIDGGDDENGLLDETARSVEGKDDQQRETLRIRKGNRENRVSRPEKPSAFGF